VRLQDRISVHPTNVDTGKLSMEGAAAGLLGVTLMTVVMLAGPVVGLPGVNMPQLLATGMRGYGLSDTGAMAMGWITWIAAGVGISVVYAWAVQRWVPRGGASLGALFATGPWLTSGLVIMPLIGAGVFGRLGGNPLGVALTTLVGWVAYGAFTGMMLRYEVASTALREVRVAE
jgi:hypothetical protein